MARCRRPLIDWLQRGSHATDYACQLSKWRGGGLAMLVLDASLSSSLSITTTISRQGALAPIRSVYMLKILLLYWLYLMAQLELTQMK